jgi:hypothetical protein
MTLTINQRLREVKTRLGELLAPQEEVAQLRAEEVRLEEQERIELATAADAAYRQAEAAWTAGDDAIVAEIAGHLPEMETLIDRWSAHQAKRPTPPGKVRVITKHPQIYMVRLNLVNVGIALDRYSRGGSGHEPRLARRRVIHYRTVNER